MLRVIYTDATLFGDLLLIHVWKKMFERGGGGVEWGSRSAHLPAADLFPDSKSSQNCSPPHGSIFALIDPAELRPGILRRKVATICPVDSAAAYFGSDRQS